MRRRRELGAVLASALAAGAATSAAAAPALANPPALQAVVDCRAIADSAQRLACYDSAVTAMSKAEMAGDLVAIDRAQRRAVRRQTFGFSLPTLAIFDRGDKAEELNRFDDALASAWRGGDGKWMFRLQSGAVWRQIDDNVLAIDPRPGTKIVIKRFSMGSYMLDVGGQPGLRAHRDQ